jgi:AraC family transcriptional regulator
MVQLQRGSYLAPIRARRTFASARVVETTYDPGQQLHRHAHSHVYVALVTSGALRERAHRRDHELTRGHLVFNGAGEAHADFVLASSTRCLNLELRPDFLRALEVGGFRPREALLYGELGTRITAVGRLESALAAPDGELEFEEALSDLLGAVTARSGRPRAGRVWLPRTIDFLHAMFRDGVRLDEVASASGLHRTHLCRAFRDATGSTIGDYVRRLRADLALQRIRTGDCTFAIIAAECGFADQSHMTRELRRLYGRSPSALRRRHANPLQDVTPRD